MRRAQNCTACCDLIELFKLYTKERQDNPAFKALGATHSYIYQCLCRPEYVAAMYAKGICGPTLYNQVLSELQRVEEERTVATELQDVCTRVYAFSKEVGEDATKFMRRQVQLFPHKKRSETVDRLIMEMYTPCRAGAHHTTYEINETVVSMVELFNAAYAKRWHHFSIRWQEEIIDHSDPLNDLLGSMRDLEGWQAVAVTNAMTTGCSVERVAGMRSPISLPDPLAWRAPSSSRLHDPSLPRPSARAGMLGEQQRTRRTMHPKSLADHVRSKANKTATWMLDELDDDELEMVWKIAQRLWKEERASWGGTVLGWFTKRAREERPEQLAGIERVRARRRMAEEAKKRILDEVAPTRLTKWSQLLETRTTAAIKEQILVFKYVDNKVAKDVQRDAANTKAELTRCLADLILLKYGNSAKDANMVDIMKAAGRVSRGSKICQPTEWSRC